MGYALVQSSSEAALNARTDGSVAPTRLHLLIPSSRAANKAAWNAGARLPAQQRENGANLDRVEQGASQDEVHEGEGERRHDRHADQLPEPHLTGTLSFWGGSLFPGRRRLYWYLHKYTQL